MECDQCGAQRPRTGPCPECGAPAPRAHSSMRQWRSGRSDAGWDGGEADWDDQGDWDAGASSRGRSSVDGRRGSSANWNAGASAGRGRSPANGRRGSSGTDWDEGDYADGAPPARSTNRNRRPAPQPEYEEVDLERALVPARNEMLPMDPSLGTAGVPALPGMPTTDEEERALGIRRPVYIPATGEKRKKKLSSWRVVSGVLSVLLVTIVACGLGGFYVYGRVQQNVKGPVVTHLTPQPFSTLDVPVTPVATPGTQGTYIKRVVTATGVDNQLNATGTTSQFLINQPVNVVMEVRNINKFPKGQTLNVSVHWFLGTDKDHMQYVELPAGSITSKQLQDTPDSCPHSGGCNVYFSLKYPSSGEGMAKVYFNRPASDTGDSPTDPSLAATIYFAVYTTLPTPTATPLKPTATPKKSSTGVSPVAWRSALASA